MTVGRGMNGESPVGVVSCRANESAPPSKISKEARKAVAKKNMDTDHMVLAFLEPPVLAPRTLNVESDDTM